MFPCRNEVDSEDDLVIRISLGVILSIVLSGSLLSLLALQPGRPMTAANLAALLAAVSALLFLVGYLRGAYPWLGGPEAPAVAGPALPREDQVLRDEFEAKLKVTERDLAKVQKAALSSSSSKLQARIKLLKVERDLLLREMELLETPEELRKLHERAQVLVRRWGRIDKALADSRPSPRREHLSRKRTEVEAEINALHQRIREVEG